MKFKIQPTYSIRDIAEMLGMPKKQTKDTLQKLNVPMHLIGKQRKILIYLSELQEAAPSLWQSLLAAYTSSLEVKDDTEEIESEEKETTIKFGR